MILQFTNKQIFFSLESIWSILDYRFKTHINQLVTTNSNEDFIQDITIDVPTLMQCYKAMSSGAYGCTTDMAEELLDSLRTQLLEKASIEGEEQQDAIDTLTAIQELKVKDVENCDRNIQESLSIILQ